MTDEISIESKLKDIRRFGRYSNDEELIQAVWQLIEDARDIKEGL